MVRYFSLLLISITFCTWFVFSVHGEETKNEKNDAPLIDKKIDLTPADKNEVDFVKDVQPILKKSCYACHGADKQEAGLRLDNKKKAFEGGDSGPVIVLRKSSKSRLIELVSGLDKETGPMPPKDEGEPLTKDQIATLKKWVDEGAKWPDDADAKTEPKKIEKYWAYQPIVSPPIPIVKNKSWVRNPIDAFILEKLEAENVAPAPEADRTTLLRRVYLDLIGLSPTPAEVGAFLQDKRSDAYDRVVDRLLASSHYGERWGRHWLDVARYADSDGYEKDLTRPFAWRYRDWVIEAMNTDMPFDIFTIQQLAGDLLKKGDREYSLAARIATGFHRNTLVNREGGVDPEEDRVKRTIDRTNTLGVAWLGMSVGCANCHTHKYDPITQKEYFGLYAFMDNLKEVDLPMTASVKAEQPDLTPREMLPDDDIDANNKEKAAIEDSANEKAKPIAPAMKVSPMKKADTNNKTKKSKKQQKVEADKEKEFRYYQAVTESTKPHKTFVHLRGDFLSPGPEVESSTLEVLPPLAKRTERADRLDLARWLMSVEHPLTARVNVNRIWLNHFGRGLYVTVDDFGKKQTETPYESPSHPQLLDWLASQFRDNGWSMKRMHKLIVTSATYRQSSAARPELVDRDPYNSWLARQNRLRVEAEIVRDLALSASGLLNPKVGGPSIRPPQPPGISELTYSDSAIWVETKGAEQYRRGLYIWFQRTSPYPSLTVLDAPEATLTCTRRERSNTPLQSLTLLNDVVFHQVAQTFGQRMFAEVTGDSKQANGDLVDRRIRHGFRLSLAREPNEHEQGILRSLYEDALKKYLSNPNAATKVLGEKEPNISATTKVSNATSKFSDTRIRAEKAALVTVARTIINLDEFFTRE